MVYSALGQHYGAVPTSQNNPAQVIFINGAFGIGKTTVARLIVRQLAHGVLFDPEPIGVGLMHAARFWRRVDDFQDLALWRDTSVRLIGLLSQVRRAVVVPMAFTNVAYLHQFLAAARQRERATFHFCLTAPLAIVRERLRAREARRGPTEWQLRRSAECCEAHGSSEFAEHIATEARSPQAVAHEILGRVRAQSAATGSAIA